ncbi:MAG: hypothetical protein QOI81_744 [Actinomycetota bacterium]|nr:hypothetical protein [Actinomycetota bacterium]
MSEGRHAAKSSRTKPALIVGIVALVAVVVVGIIMFTSGGKSPPGTITQGDKPIPDFTFTVAKTQAVPTRSGVKPQKLANKATTATKAAAALLDTFYTEAFLNPNVWGKDSNAFDNFTPDAKAAAAKKLTILTAGPNAADELKNLHPVPSKLTSKVLFDDKGNAYQVMATVEFMANATLKAGGHATLVSTGQYFLKQVGGSWKVVAFEVKRADTNTAPPSPTGTPSGQSPKETPS